MDIPTTPTKKERNPTLQRIRRFTRLLMLLIVGFSIFIVGAFITYLPIRANNTIAAVTSITVLFLGAILYLAARLMQLIGAYRFSLRKQTTNQIARTENKYKILIQHSQDMITILDNSGLIKYQSPASLQLLGFKDAELEGKNIYDLIHNDDACLLENALITETSERFAIRMQRHDGKWRYFECTRTDLRTNSLIGGVVVNFHDITELKIEEEKRIEKELTARLFQQEAEVEKERALYEKRQKEIIGAKNIELELAYETIQAQNQKIMDGLYYAKTIQNALLPETALIKKYFPDSFILLKPKEIVSGDFYWFTPKDDYFIFTLADCTGHGVPGALMTMIGNTLLNQIILENDVTDPATILYYMNIGVRKALRQAEHSDRIDSRMDGMDIAVLKIEPKNKRIIFAGANQPLFLIRNSQITEYPSEKKTVGGKQKENERTYQNVYINYQTKDCIYLASDGVADQFNPDGKKFMRQRFIQTILEKNNEKMEAQALHIDNTLTNWMSDYEQIDDMVIVGVRL